MLFNFKKYSNWLWVSISCVLIFLMSERVWAQGVADRSGGGSANLGAVAANLTGAADVFTGVFSAIFYVIGVAMVAAGIMRYRDHRQNPVQTPLSRVIFLLIAGIIIGFFPHIINYIHANIANT